MSDEVRDGGPGAVRRVPGGRVTTIAVGPMDNDAYILECGATGARCLVDAADEPDRLLRALAAPETGRPRLDLVVTTHRHADHWQALGPVVAATGARTLAGRPDVEGIPVRTDRALDDGDVVEVGELRLEVVRLVGHTPGAVALLLRGDPPYVFTGDSLFPGGVGRTTSPEDFDSLYRDVTTKIFDRLPDETRVLPGHGRSTTLGAERPHLAEWRARGW